MTAAELEVLSELIRILSRISNSTPYILTHADYRRLEKAKRLLSSNVVINVNEIPQ